VTIELESIPRFTVEEALAIAREEYGLSGAAAALPSERDQNFLISDPGRGKFVLKIANRDDSAELLDFQHQAMRRVAASSCMASVPEIVPSKRGADIVRTCAPTGIAHCVRVLGWMEGTVLAECTPRSAPLLESIGTVMAQVDLALERFAHPAMHRTLQWDLRRAGQAQVHAGLLPRLWRDRVELAFARWKEIDWTILRHGVIHGDANDNNVLVTGGRMSGLLDFGDSVYSATVCELAIALAYAMLREPRPLEAARPLIRAYHRENPLTQAEQEALFALILARLAASLCYAAHNAARNPGDPYQVVTEAAAKELLQRLEAYPPHAALAAMREACG